VSVEFKPSTLELIQTGATAGLLLDAQRILCREAIDRVLGHISEAVTNRKLSAAMAIGFCHEIAAFRRILSSQEAKVKRGEHAARSLQESSDGRTPSSAA